MSGRRRLFTGGVLGRLLALMLLLAMLVPDQPALASAPKASAPVLTAKKVVVVLADGLSLSDLSPARTPHLWQMQAKGAIGVMNQNTLGAKNDVNSYLTIGAGTKAVAPKRLAEAFANRERVPGEVRPVTGGELYFRNNGLAPKGAIVFPDLPQLIRLTQQERYTILPGLLGSAVEQAGGRTAVLGNADLGPEVHRPAVLLAMNEAGTVDDGDLQAGLLADPTWPYGLRTDVDALYQSYLHWRNRDALLVLQTGDLLRLQAASDQLDPASQKRLHQLAVQEVDRLVGLLLPESGPNTLLAVIAPTPAAMDDQAATPLSPVLLAGGDMKQGSLLTSSTTKRGGLVANYDLAPTFVQFLGGDASRYPFLGQPIRPIQTHSAATSSPNSLQAGAQAPAVQLADLVQQMQVPYFARKLLLRPWLNIWIGLTVALLLAAMFRRRWLRLLQPLALLLLIFPLAWLLVPLYQPQSVTSTALFTLAVALTIWVVLLSLEDARMRLGFLAFGTVVTLLVDVWLGAPLEKQALLSYDPIAGARYYGIGNEYMGVLLGALLLVLNQWLGRAETFSMKQRTYLLLVFLFVVYLFAAPTLGTNAGGAVSAAVGGAYALFLQGERKLRWRHLVSLLAGVSAVVLCMALLNLYLPNGEQTHIGRAANRLLGGQFAEIYQMAARKIWLNLTLLRASAWGKLFLAALALLGLRMVQHRNQRQTVQPDRFLLRQSQTVLVTALAAFAFNDSGVVAASLTLLYAIVPLCLPEAGAKRQATEARPTTPTASLPTETEESCSP